ncbi:hypothetical protein GJAV_G00247270 [Gymnothorax javanicus]|nr:hypothetical protein GJAV_G00247270 [Gymnothorax javanicus]
MWVVEKIRVSVERTNLPLPISEYSFRIADVMFGDKATSEMDRRLSLCPNVITPATIPKFCIPPKISSQQEAKNTEPTKAAPGFSPSNEMVARELVSPHIIQVENVDETPFDNAYSDEESTNADPQSQAALSLPHLAKAQTCYGFSTLLESPHTRRKESLFHSDPGSCSIALVLPRARPSACSKASFGRGALSSRLSPRGPALSRQGTLDSDTTSSTESSPFSSPMLARSVPKSSLFKALSHERLLSRGAQKMAMSRNDSLSTDEGSSTDNSPNILRRASEGLIDLPSGAFSLAPPAIFPTDLVLYKNMVTKESRVPLGRDGTLRLSAEYCPDNQRLRVRLISTEGLYRSSVDPKCINCSVTISMMPGKSQKQRSTVIRKSRNPIFNEDFFFDGISEDDISHRFLRFKVINKMSAMKRDYTLGA